MWALDDINISDPNVGVLYSSDSNGLTIHWNYQSQSNDEQSLSWAYKLDEDFYSTATSATEVSGSSSVSGTSWLSGVSYGNHTLYVALLDQPGGNLLSTDNHSFDYQSGDSGTQSGGGGTQSETGGYDQISIDSFYAYEVLSGDELLNVSIQYASESANYATPRWAYKIDENFYSSSIAAIEVSGEQVDGWAADLSEGSHHLYVALLDPFGGDTILATKIKAFKLSCLTIIRARYC